MKKLMLVKSGPDLIAGLLKEESSEELEMASKEILGRVILCKSGITLAKPRLVSINFQKGEVGLMKLLGSPAEMEVGNAMLVYSYENTDEAFDKLYSEDTTDIPGLRIVQ